MTKSEWQKHYGFSDEDMSFFDYLINQGCRITKILDKTALRVYTQNSLVKGKSDEQERD